MARSGVCDTRVGISILLNRTLTLSGIYSILQDQTNPQQIGNPMRQVWHVRPQNRRLPPPSTPRELGAGRLAS